MKNKKQLQKVCKKFIKEQKIWCPDTIYDSDRVVLNALDFIKDICDIVGYYQEEDEE